MHNFKIVCDNGNITVISARTRSRAIELFLEAEGCSAEWFSKHCKCKKISKNNENVK